MLVSSRGNAFGNRSRANMRIWISINAYGYNGGGLRFGAAFRCARNRDAFRGMAAMGVVGSIAAHLGTPQTQIRLTMRIWISVGILIAFDRRRLRSDFGCA
jgi:hypothetical protein